MGPLNTPDYFPRRYQNSAKCKIVKHYRLSEEPFRLKNKHLIHVYIPKIQEKQDRYFYTRIVTKKYHIPVLKGFQIQYTQNPWPGLISSLATDQMASSKINDREVEIMEWGIKE